MIPSRVGRSLWVGLGYLHGAVGGAAYSAGTGEGERKGERGGAVVCEVKGAGRGVGSDGETQRRMKMGRCV